MPVKDLVKQFENSSTSPERPSRTTPGASNQSTSPRQPPPSPARFVHHPLLQRRSLPPPSSSQAVVNARDAEDRPGIRQPPWAKSEERISGPTDKDPLSIVAGSSEAPVTTSVKATDSLGVGGPPNSRYAGNMSRMTPERAPAAAPSNLPDNSKLSSPVVASSFPHRESRFSGTRNAEHRPEFEGNLGNLGHSRGEKHSRQKYASVRREAPITPTYSAFEEGSSTKPSVPLPSRHARSVNDIPMAILSRDSHDYHDLTTSRSPSPSATLVSHQHFAPHVPIAAKTVFSRGSAPLLLPPLDDYLASIPPPTFSSFPSNKPTSGGEYASSAMFPPLDQFAATGHTVEDLENNATIEPLWGDRNTIFGALVNLVIGVMGSSAIASYYSLQGLYDGLQLFALLLSTIAPHSSNVGDKWREIFLGTIPNILALNLSTTLLESFILLVVLMSVSALLLYYLHVATTRIAHGSSPEGFQSKDTSGWGILFASFTLTLIYLPLSTIAVHALLWSDDFWVVPNPYINATTLPPNIPPLGPPSQFRDPLDFCYTTTMRKDEINYAPALVILSALTFIFLTVWYPIRLAKVVVRAVPRVDRFTELGERRSKVDMDHEYERLLDRDKNPLNFLYKDLRMRWGTYKSSYLFVKLSALLIVAFLSPGNCVFRNANPNIVSIVRQSILVLAMFAFLLVQSFLAPFLDPVSNASEWISRAGYVAFAVLGLATATDLPASVQSALNGPVLYIIYALNYGFTFYFLFIDMSWSRRLVKKIFRRIDFSIDIFSPHLDISSTSRHVRRRIWQETISVLLLTSPDCAIPKSQKMVFSESQESQWPPYLLDFQGSPAERHVENLKILREVGGLAYAKGVALHTGRCSERLKRAQERIQRHFIGPDSYWKTPSQSGYNGGYFGNTWWIPFPPTLVMRYDSGQLAVLEKLQELEEYISQNEDDAVQAKRDIRIALRALDGLVVSWPYTHVHVIGSHTSCCWGRRYTAQTAIEYESCVFSITRRGSLRWKGVQLGSGFDVQLTYTPDVHVDGDVIGLDADFDLTPQLAKFLELNKALIHYRLHSINAKISDYRRQTRRGMRAKCDALTYEFLCTVYSSPKDPHELAEVIAQQEKDPRVRQTFVGHEDALTMGYERMVAVTRSEATAWWYLYWDDLWRRNYDTISALGTHAADFNPHYPTSIAYRPLPRPALEAFLIQRGLFHKQEVRQDFIHSGVLNKLYYRLNQIVFRGSEKEIPIHLGDASNEVDIEDLEFSSQTKSGLGTGGGTDHDDISIRARPLYQWERIYDDPLNHGAGGRHKIWLPKLAVWLGLTPFWKSGKSLTNGVSLDVQLEDGKYVLLEHAVNKLKETIE